METLPENVITVVMADDDDDDCLLVSDALQELSIPHQYFCLPDGFQLMDFLNHQGKYQDSSLYPAPDIVLLDLNMPRLNGREALTRIKTDPKTRKIPVIVLTTSEEEGDIITSYEAGANAYIVKPVTFEGLVDAMRALGKFWFNTAKLPKR